MKGISAVVVVILLLLIAIAVVGMSFSFFSQVTTTAGEAAVQDTETQVEQLRKRISIDAVTNESVAIRNSGSVDIPASEIQVYVSGGNVTCTPALADFAAQTVQTCYFGAGAADDCNSGEKVRVVTPSFSVENTCP